jgi:hypothetical protein
LSSNLLVFWKSAPKWGESLVIGGDQNFWVKLQGCDGKSDDYLIWSALLSSHIWRDDRSSYTSVVDKIDDAVKGEYTDNGIDLLIDIGSRWLSAESYKVFNAYEKNLKSQSVSLRDFRRRYYRDHIGFVKRRSNSEDSYHLALCKWHSILNECLKETATYNYVKSGTLLHNVSADDQVGQNTEGNRVAKGANKLSAVLNIDRSFTGFQDVVNITRGWVSLTVKDLILDSRETIDEVQILSIKQIIDNMRISEDDVTDLNNRILTWIRIIQTMK